MKLHTQSLLGSIVMLPMLALLFSCHTEHVIPPPQVEGVTPDSAYEGDTVVISGTNFSETLSENTVAFNGTQATLVASTKTSITTVVPQSTTTGKIIVTTNGRLVTSASDFTVLTSVYITGNVYEANGVVVDGIFWQDGVKAALPAATGSAYMTNVVVQGKSVYYARTYNDPDNGSVAAYWKNGVMTNLTDASHDIVIRAICVSPQGDIYVAGNFDDSGAVWKNGVLTLITDFTGSCHITCIGVSGNDVYVGGADQSSGAKYWKNGKGKALTDGKLYASVAAIAVSGTDTYIVGSYGKEAVYWKNDVLTTLPRTGSDDAITGGLFLAGNDVYICGGVETNEQTTAAFWKNGVETVVQDGIWLNSIFVHAGDVYLAGVSKTATPVYWKNQVSIPLTDGTRQGAAFSIAVR